MATPRKRPLEDKNQPYTYIWRLRGKVILVGYGKDNRCRPEVARTCRSVACVEMLRKNEHLIKVELFPCKTKEEARTLERKYNTAPGCGGWKGMHTAKGLANIRASQLGKRHSKETGLKHSIAMKGNTHLLGHVHSKTTRQAIGRFALGRPASDLCRAKASERAVERNKGNSFAKGWTKERKEAARKERELKHVQLYGE